MASKPITDVAEMAGKVTKIKTKIGKHPDDMSFDECMAHVRRVLFWDPIDGQWTDIDFLKSTKWDRLAGYIAGAHSRELESLKTENAKLRRLATMMGYEPGLGVE